jgi:hypothetical protein
VKTSKHLQKDGNLNGWMVNMGPWITTVVIDIQMPPGLSAWCE